ncbi:hypothetical protein FOCG_16294 [Fusarium oxysporum f. sp. radicis-lycopersici 26381]|uniref:Uncharacterized protein n=1 Tax=Fusarium oxysporum f. sp. pisi HDV247 TaxID=1080344 RepID=W9NFX1_FUSOX|nr:hypothetical protein FOVG_18885 [Fusarium oxysporum f. sp. pisi HDV247]EXL41490.1 hypothetical protein FOCG_16294 [Fusarium oxysporum f. sp. radicis-lycopersici 26381]
MVTTEHSLEQWTCRSREDAAGEGCGHYDGEQRRLDTAQLGLGVNTGRV